MHVHSRARQVVLSAPYWVVNKTNLQIQVEDTTPNGGLPISAQPGLSDMATAVPFRCMGLRWRVAAVMPWSVLHGSRAGGLCARDVRHAEAVPPGSGHCRAFLDWG